MGLLPVLLEHKNGIRWEREQMAEDKMRPNQGQGEIVIYQAEDGLTKVECRFVNETVWLTQQQMAELFHTSRSNIVEHIGHIYEEGELDETSTCRKFRQVRMEGNRQVTAGTDSGHSFFGKSHVSSSVGLVRHQRGL